MHYIPLWTAEIKEKFQDKTKRQRVLDQYQKVLSWTPEAYTPPIFRRGEPQRLRPARAALPGGGSIPPSFAQHFAAAIGCELVLVIIRTGDAEESASLHSAPTSREFRKYRAGA